MLISGVAKQGLTKQVSHAVGGRELLRSWSLVASSSSSHTYFPWNISTKGEFFQRGKHVIGGVAGGNKKGLKHSLHSTSPLLTGLSATPSQPDSNLNFQLSCYGNSFGNGPD